MKCRSQYQQHAAAFLTLQLKCWKQSPLMVLKDHGTWGSPVGLLDAHCNCKLKHCNWGLWLSCLNNLYPAFLRCAALAHPEGVGSADINEMDSSFQLVPLITVTPDMTFQLLPVDFSGGKPSSAGSLNLRGKIMLGWRGGGLQLLGRKKWAEP